MEVLDTRVTELPGIKLVIIDTISAYLGRTDRHKNADVRALLMALSEFADRHKGAVLCVSHLNKSSAPAAYRISGSVAFGAAPRSSYAVRKDKIDPGRRLVVPIKANLGPDTTGLAYRVGVRNDIPVVE